MPSVLFQVVLRTLPPHCMAEQARKSSLRCTVMLASRSIAASQAWAAEAWQTPRTVVGDAEFVCFLQNSESTSEDRSSVQMKHRRVDPSQAPFPGRSARGTLCQRPADLCYEESA